MPGREPHWKPALQIDLPDKKQHSDKQHGAIKPDYCAEKRKLLLLDLGLSNGYAVEIEHEDQRRHNEIETAAGTRRSA